MIKLSNRFTVCFSERTSFCSLRLQLFQEYEGFRTESERAQNYEGVKTPKSAYSRLRNENDIPRRFAVASPRSLFSPASYSPAA